MAINMFNRLKKIWLYAIWFFLSRCHYLSALFRHCGVAMIIFIFILPIAEPTQDWGHPAFLSIVEAKIGFLKINLTYQKF